MICLKKLGAAFLLSVPCVGFSQGANHVKAKVSLSPGAVRAAYVAYEKFSIFIRREKGYGDLGLFLSDIDNYVVTIDGENNGYLVRFEPLPYEGEVLSGGGAVYHVEGVKYRVVGEEHSK